MILLASQVPLKSTLCIRRRTESKVVDNEDKRVHAQVGCSGETARRLPASFSNIVPHEIPGRIKNGNAEGFTNQGLDQK